MVGVATSSQPWTFYSDSDSQTNIDGTNNSNIEIETIETVRWCLRVDVCLNYVSIFWNKSRKKKTTTKRDQQQKKIRYEAYQLIESKRIRWEWSEAQSKEIERKTGILNVNQAMKRRQQHGYAFTLSMWYVHVSTLLVQANSFATWNNFLLETA